MKGWPYALGALGAAAFGFAGLLFALAFVIPNPGGVATGALYMMGASALVVGGAWMGILRSRQGGFGVIAASFAVSGAAAYLAKAQGAWGTTAAAVLLFLLALCAFAAAHALLPHMLGVRICGICALAGLVPGVLASTGKVEIGDGTGTLLVVVAFGALSALGFTLAFGMAMLKLRADDPERL